MLDLPLRGPAGAGPSHPAPSPADRPPIHLPPAAETVRRPMSPAPPRRQKPRRRRWLPPLLIALVVVSLYFLIRPEAAVPVPSLERVDFGELQVGRESSLFDVSFSNGGERSMRLTDLSLVGPGAAAFSILSDNCIGFEQAPLQSCTVTLQFVPFDSGEHRAGLVLAGNVKKDELGLPLVGLAIAPSIEAPSQVAFGSHEVGSRERGQDLVILNGGSAPLVIQRIYIDGRDAGTSGSFAAAARAAWVSGRVASCESPSSPTSPASGSRSLSSRATLRGRPPASG